MRVRVCAGKAYRAHLGSGKLQGGDSKAAGCTQLGEVSPVRVCLCVTHSHTHSSPAAASASSPPH